MTSKTERLGQNGDQGHALSGAARRSNSAPPYYLGHAAQLWLTVLASQRRTSAARAQ
jgi:hypothetical protein